MSTLPLLFVVICASAAMHVEPDGLCDQIKDVNCIGGQEIAEFVLNSPEGCCSNCTQDPRCNAWTWEVDGRLCRIKSACLTRLHNRSGFVSGLAGKHPTRPFVFGPTPSQVVVEENPLGIVPAPKRSDNFFLLIGDYGAPTDASWAHSCGGCQQQVATMMKNYVQTYKAKGQTCLFVAALGDNFYASGVQDAAHWKTQWDNVYGVTDPSSGLFDIPWLAVMGNHDHGDNDPSCSCGKVCKQFNTGPRPSGTEKYWMPDYYWYYFIPGVDLEIIGLDTNGNDIDGLNGNGCSGCAAACGGTPQVTSFLMNKMTEGTNFLEQRAHVTAAKTALIIQHYPGIGADMKNKFDAANGGRTKSLSAYGHEHDQVCQGSRTNGCDVILSGGGGGWQGGSYYGFTAVHLTDDGGYQTKLETDEVRIPQNSCAYMCDQLHSLSVENVTAAANEIHV